MKRLISLARVGACCRASCTETDLKSTGAQAPWGFESLALRHEINGFECAGARRAGPKTRLQDLLPWQKRVGSRPRRVFNEAAVAFLIELSGRSRIFLSHTHRAAAAQSGIRAGPFTRFTSPIEIARRYVRRPACGAEPEVH
jgi:hypothetical protein